MKLSKIPGALLRAHQLQQISLAELHHAQAPSVPAVVSFTSIPSRLPIVHLTVRSILAGTRKPEKIVLWLNDQLASQLPSSLSQLLGPRFEIRSVTGTSSHRKLVHSLEAFPDKVLVTCDDDMMYKPHWLEYLYEDHCAFPQDVIANECRAIAYDERGHLLPYRYWYREAKAGVTYDGLLPIGFGGVLYPPRCLHSDVCDASLYLALTPKADDLWFKAMSYLRGTRSRRASRPLGFPIAILNSQGTALRSTNVKQDGNRAQWHAIAQHYALPAFAPFAIDRASNSPPTSKASMSGKSPVPSEAIDAVITWVDGADPMHADKLHRYLAELGREGRPLAALPTRFDDAGELGYCVASLLKFAPWLRHIHIVTDAQTPPLMQWLANTPFTDKVSLVDHKVIFAGYEHYLPTFNTRSITSLLWKIPGLADKFIFLNDDFMVIRPVRPDDFFRGEKMVLRGSWQPMLPLKWQALLEGKNTPGERGDQRAKYSLSQKRAARLLGFQYRYFQLRHDPHPMQVQNLRDYFSTHSSVLENNIGYKLRSREQFTIESLSAHLALHQSGAEVDGHLKTLQIKPASQSRLRIKYKLKGADRNKSFAFICIQSMDRAPSRVKDLVFAWLRKRIGTLDG
jgi:hypothetical protein